MKRLLWLFLLTAALSTQASAATLFKCDFDRAGSASFGHATATSSTKTVGATAALRPVGTVNMAGTTQPSGALLLSVRPGGSGPWSASLTSGFIPLQSKETSLGKLTLSFSLSSSANRPAKVRIESFNTAHHRTGALEGTIYPAAPDFFQRYALDLSAMKAAGIGKFQPLAPFVKFSYIVTGDTLTQGTSYELRLDNVNYATPAYYVSPRGSDTHNGRSEATAFATPQKALDRAQPGDIVLLMDGKYQAVLAPVASFPRAGRPDAWIVLKNYPGQHPTLSTNGWSTVNIAKGSKQAPSSEPALAYLEVRGLHIRGEGDVAKQKYPDAMGKADPRINNNGISVDGRFAAETFHDIRIADNLVEFCPGGGISSIEGDWITVEHNICRSNCFTTIYAPSGISVMGAANFDARDNIYKKLIRDNICCHNQTYEKWGSAGRYSDGNGIILDVNQHTSDRPTVNYLGRTLVQSNLSYDNGGSGIHAYRANRVDIIGNTAYHNSASVNLEYGEIFAGSADDIHIIDNILVGPVANTAAGEKPEPVTSNWSLTHAVISHNLYFGGNIAPVISEGDIVGDPLFIHPTIDDKTANFHLKASSPALGRGIAAPFAPVTDLDAKTRKYPHPAEGAYEE